MRRPNIPYSHFFKYPGPPTLKHTTFPNQGRDIYKSVNKGYRSIKVTKLFSSSAKAEIEKIENSNVVYKYDCICPEFYIRETKRALDIRIRDHQTKSRNTNIYQLIKTCSCSQKFMHFSLLCLK